MSLTDVSWRLQACIARACAYAPFCDMIWMETSNPSLEQVHLLISCQHTSCAYCFSHEPAPVQAVVGRASLSSNRLYRAHAMCLC